MMKKGRFEILTTTTKQPYIEKASDALEQAGIPLVVEHSNVEAKQKSSTEFRVWVPRHNFQSALKLLGTVTTAVN